MTALYTGTLFKVCVKEFVVLAVFSILQMPACKQFPCWLANGAWWKQGYLLLCLKFTGSISMLKNQQTLLIPSIAFSNKNISLAWIHCFFIPLLQDWTSGSLVHEFQKGWRETLKFIMKSTTKRKYTKFNCITLAFTLRKQLLAMLKIFLYMYYFYIVIFLYLQRWKLKTIGFLQS